MQSKLADLFQALHGATVSVTLAAVALAPGASPQANIAGHWRAPAVIRQARFPLYVTSGMSPHLTGEHNIDLVTDHWEPPTGTLSPNSTLGSLPPPRAALLIRVMSKLPISTLGRMFGVSRQTYHGWVLGRPVSPENAEKITRVLETIQSIGQVRNDVGNFLISKQLGTSPIDLIAAGRYDAAIGLALYPDEAPSRDVVSVLNWNDTDAGSIASFLYKTETQFAHLDQDIAGERYADEGLGVTTIVVDA